VSLGRNSSFTCLQLAQANTGTGINAGCPVGDNIGDNLRIKFT